MHESVWGTRFLFGERILEIRREGQASHSRLKLPHAVAIDLDDPSYHGGILPFPDESQDAVISSHVLEHIADYRQAVSEWFRVLRVGGFLVIAVPHQFLFERKLAPPSRFDTSHERFYTAASLLQEIEEALDPYSYRIRFLEDNDADFDYRAPLEKKATGCSEVVVALEKVRRPDYADAVLADIQPSSKTAHHLNILDRPDAADGPTVCMRSEPGDVGRIAVMKLDHRGDFILAKPAMLELRRRFPAAKLTLICGPWNAPEAAALDIFDDILTFTYGSETGGAITSGQRDQMLEAFAAMMKGKPFDLAVDLRVDPDTRYFLSKIEAKQRAGFGAEAQLPFLDIAPPFVNPTTLQLWRNIGPEHFTSTIGARNEYGITYAGRSYVSIKRSCLLFASGIKVEAGAYVVEVDITPTQQEFSVGIEVSANPGGETLKGWLVQTVRQRRAARFEIDLREPKEIEIRIYSRQFGLVRPFQFRGCRLAKRGEWHGPHQQELMYMLACMVGLRMNNPYRVFELAP